jgi:hypothetical protein
METGDRWGWNQDRGRYLTRRQARLCLDIYEKAVEAINRKAGEVLPPPRSLASRGFEPRACLPDCSQINPDGLHRFYDGLARRLARSQR